MPVPHIQSSHFYSNSTEKRIKNFYWNHMGFAALDIALVAVGMAFVLLLTGGMPFIGLVLPGVMLVSLVAVRMLETIKLWWGARQDRLFDTQLSHLASNLKELITAQLDQSRWTVSQARRFLQLVNQSKNQNYGYLANCFEEAPAEASALYQLPFYVFGVTAFMALTMLKGSAVIIVGTSIPLGLIIGPLVAILGMYLLARGGAAVYQAYQARQFSKMAALTVQENGLAHSVPMVGEGAKPPKQTKDGLPSNGMFSGDLSQPAPPPYPYPTTTDQNDNVFAA